MRTIVQVLQTVCVSLLLYSVPSFAIEGEGCIFDRIDNERKASLFAAWQARQRPDHSTMAAISEGSRICTSLHQWNLRQKNIVIDYTLTRIIYEALLMVSPFSSQDTSNIVAQFDAEAIATFDRWVSGNDAAEVNEEVRRFVERTGVQISADNRQYLYELIAIYRELRHARDAIVAH